MRVDREYLLMASCAVIVLIHTSHCVHACVCVLFVLNILYHPYNFEVSLTSERLKCLTARSSVFIDHRSPNPDQYILVFL